MKRLRLDALTASHCQALFASAQTDLTLLAQAIDEDWKRYAPDPETGSRHLISTMGNRLNGPPRDLPYYNTSLIRPDALPAENRPMNDRFLRPTPRLCAEVRKIPEGYELDTALLRLDEHIMASMDGKGSVSLYVANIELPRATLIAMIGRPLGDVIQVGLEHDPLILDAHFVDAAEMTKVHGRTKLTREKDISEGLRIDVKVSGTIDVPFREIYEKPFF